MIAENKGFYHTNASAVRSPTWRDKLRWRLFPPIHIDIPEEASPYKEVLVCRSVCELSIMCRIKLLFTGRLLVETRTVTEHEIGKFRSFGAFSSMPPKWLEPKKTAPLDGVTP